jgi:quercetin 2,3-dioxygenase
MLLYRASQQRGKANFGWLYSAHTFSFGQYHDPQWMGFGPLRVINQDHVAAGGGFSLHSHANMEIISVVLSGALEHKDSLGTGSVIRPGDVQRMSAGSGITHSEYNASKTEGVHFLQIWIMPDTNNIAPSYAQEMFSAQQRYGRLCLVASKTGEQGSLSISQDARMYISHLQAGAHIQQPLDPKRKTWLQMISGRADLNGQALSAGDGVGLMEEHGLSLHILETSEFLLFDLPG